MSTETFEKLKDLVRQVFQSDGAIAELSEDNKVKIALSWFIQESRGEKAAQPTQQPRPQAQGGNQAGGGFMELSGPLENVVESNGLINGKIGNTSFMTLTKKGRIATDMQFYAGSVVNARLEKKTSQKSGKSYWEIVGLSPKEG